MKTLLPTAAVIAALASSAASQEVRITPDVLKHTFTANGQDITIERNQDQDAVIAPDFAKTSRACPPFCIHPMSAGEGVETVGEIEVIHFLENEVAAGEGFLLDSRIPSWFAKGAIPGAINLPFTTLEPDNLYRDEILQAFGGELSDGKWDFSDAKELTLYCNGPWCDQSPRAIKNLLDVGYPAEKVRYYRGGMQMWFLLGLSTVAQATAG